MLGYKGPPQPSPALGDASMRVIVMSRSDALGAGAEAEDSADPRTRPLHALQRLP
jgi:hypothetical protein